MARRLVGSLFVLAAVLFPASARADVGVYPLTKVVPVGGVIHGWGDGAGMPVYLVPAAAGPKRSACRRGAICEPKVARPPGRPFVLLGRLRRAADLYERQTFDFQVPTRTRPGRHRMYLYCKPCGGSLIQSGLRLEGETIRITARPTPRRIRVRTGPTRMRFLSSQPAGVVLRLRLTVPHGMRVKVTGSIRGVAGVLVSTDNRASCRQRGAVDVCTPAFGCPTPAVVWRFELRRLAGPAGLIRAGVRRRTPTDRLTERLRRAGDPARQDLEPDDQYGFASKTIT